MQATQGPRSSSWETMKRKIQDSWDDVESVDLDRFEGRLGQLVQFLHERTDLDRNGLRLRLEELE
ncbi:MAG: hypothetical protein ABEK50_00620, partial [bacterium]